MTALESPSGEVLVVPDGWVIDPLAVARLGAQLAANSAEVKGAVAPTSVLTSGSSYRTQAERCALEPFDTAYAAAEPIAGVALLRRGVAYEVDGAKVTIGGGLLVDPGAHSHDANAPLAPMEDATSLGRSPFPRRPLVLFLGLESDRGRAVWARNLVNDLLGHETEARLATATTADGRHLTRPCRPGPDTVRALQPDVVITLDDTAESRISSWCDRRSTVVIHHTGERTLSTELVSWRIGDAFGRVRGLIGSAVDAGTLAELCSRLCAGPPPLPPATTNDDERWVSAPRARARTQRGHRSVAVVRPSPDSPGSDRLDRFLAEATALGEPTSVFGPDEATNAIEHDVVLLSSDVDPAKGAGLAQARSTVGKRTIVDVASPGQATELVQVCRTATAPTSQVRNELEQVGIAVRRLPILLTRAELERLRRARPSLPSDGPVVLGVRVDVAEPRQIRALTEAIADLLDTDAAITIEWIGSVDYVPTSLRDDPRVRSAARKPIDQCGHWTAQAWVGSKSTSDLVGRPDALIGCSYLGIPTVFDTSCCGDVVDDVIGRWALGEPTEASQWAERLRTIVSAPDDAREGLAFRADLLFGQKAGTSVVNRLLGWGSFTGRSQ